MAAHNFFLKNFKKSSLSRFIKLAVVPKRGSESEMETGRVDRHRSGRQAGRVNGRVEILRPAGQADQKTGQILLFCN